jgi:hypothetical protein
MFWKTLDGGPDVWFERGLDHVILGLRRELDSDVRRRQD